MRVRPGSVERLAHRLRAVVLAGVAGAAEAGAGRDRVGLAEQRGRIARLVAGEVEADDVGMVLAAARCRPRPRRRSCGSRSTSIRRLDARVAPRVVDPGRDPAVVVGVGQPDRGRVVGRDDQLDVDRALGGAAHQVLVRDVAVVLGACGSRSPRGRRCAGSRGSRPTGSGRARRTRPSGTLSPLRSASVWISAGGTVPSRWTCSSASGASYAAQQHAPLAPAAPSLTWTADSSAVAASVALASPRAWTIASGRSGPTSAPIGAILLRPDAVVDLVVLAPAVAAQGGDDEPDGARVDALDVARALGRHRAGHRGRRQRRVLDEVASGPPSAADHRAEALGGAAVVERALDLRARGLARRARAATGRARRPRARPSPRAGAARARAPVRWSTDSRTSSALPAVVPSTSSMSVISATVSSPAPRGDLDQRLGQLLRVLAGGHERARAGLDVEHQRVEALGQLLGQDRGHDQRDRLDRAGGVADGVQAAVGGREVGGLADDRAAGLGAPRA